MFTRYDLTIVLGRRSLTITPYHENAICGDQYRSTSRWVAACVSSSASAHACLYSSTVFARWQLHDSSVKWKGVAANWARPPESAKWEVSDSDLKTRLKVSVRILMVSFVSRVCVPFLQQHWLVIPVFCCHRTNITHFLRFWDVYLNGVDVKICVQFDTRA